MGWFNHQPVIFRGVFLKFRGVQGLHPISQLGRSRCLCGSTCDASEGLVAARSLRQRGDRGRWEKFHHGSCWFTRSYGVCMYIYIVVISWIWCCVFVELKHKRKSSKQTHDIFRLMIFPITKHQNTRLRDELSRAEAEVLPGSSHLCCFQRGLKAFSGGTKGDQHGWWWFFDGSVGEIFFLSFERISYVTSWHIGIVYVGGYHTQLFGDSSKRLQGTLYYISKQSSAMPQGFWTLLM